MSSTTQHQAFFCFFALSAAGLGAQTIYTVPSAQALTIQSAIDQSQSGDAVWVLPGTYRENLDFKGKDITLRAFGGSARNTIIDGGNQAPTITLTQGESRQARIENLTITGGNGVHGGGLRIESAAPTLRGLILRGNVASTAGGAIGGKLSAPARATSPLVVDCLFENNRTAASAQAGGAAVGFVGDLLAAVQPQPEFLRCIFLDNQGGEQGGAVHFQAFGTPRFDRCIFARNQDSSKSAGERVGGAAFNVQLRTTLTATNCRFYANESQGAAVVKTYQGAAVLRNCTAVGNRGGTALLASQPTRGRPLAASSIEAHNCILWQNASLELETSPPSYASLTTHHCVLSPNQSYDTGVKLGAGMLTVDPKLANPENWTHHLLPGSPCIDAGSSVAAGGLAQDMDGEARVQGAAVDIGADEFDPQGVRLYHDRGPISLARPGALNMRIEAGAARAGMDWVLLPSLSGVLPGTQIFGMALPLNLDASSSLLLSIGKLDGTGAVQLPFNLAGLKGNTSLVGVEVHWAAAVFSAGVAQRYSNSTYTRLVQ